MSSVRPEAPRRPCPACGRPVDPFRASEVVLLEDGFRYLCGWDCRMRFLDGERAYDAGPDSWDTDPISGIAPKKRGSGPTLRNTRQVDDAVPITAFTASSSRRIGPVLALSTAILAALIAPLAHFWPLALLSAICTVGAAAWALWSSVELQRAIGMLAWIIGPLGASLAAVAGLVERFHTTNAWIPLFGAGIASAVVVSRTWLDQHAQVPLRAVLRDLTSHIPERVRVPLPSDSSSEVPGYAEDQTSRIRTGEEVVALAGDVVAVDAVVKAGEASALLHPSALTPTRRVPGDPLLAGARIVEGAVRLLVTRVGDERALLRPVRFGSGEGHEAAPIARLSERVTQWGGLGALAAALLALSIGDVSGPVGSLSAASAVLIAAPLLAVRRSAVSPLVAAAANACARGIIFQHARAMDAAGRATVAAFCTHGTVTEGRPEVLDVHPIGEGTVEPLIALAAAAEAAAHGHHFAQAIMRFAESRNIAPEPVRRATFLPGRGVTALGSQGEPIVVGNRQLLLDEGVSVAVADREANSAEARGLTVLFMGVGGRVRGIFLLQDLSRRGARAAVQRVFDMHVEAVLLSGDHRATVEAIARDLDVGHIKAELLPEERGAEVRRLRETGEVVAAIGHADQDDAALAAADVPIVLAAAGGPAGERSVALASHDLRDAAAALWIARAARQGAYRATMSSIAAGSLIVVGAVLGILGPGLAAVLACAIDSYALPSGTRILRRIELRMPARS